MNANIDALNQIHEKAKELNRQDNRLRARYFGDAKYTRIHKRLLKSGALAESERRIFEALSGIKQQADDLVLQNTQLLANESYFERMIMPLVINEFQTRQNIKLNPDDSRTINRLVVTEYMNEFASGSTTGARTW
jgi:type I restriction enzyme R subunit